MCFFPEHQEHTGQYIRLREEEKAIDALVKITTWHHIVLVLSQHSKSELLKMSGFQRGKLIVVEGLDRAGKSTQVELLVNNLAKEGHKVEHKRFPGKQ